ncbi:MAG TPA: acyl-CoA dehydrogenase family protein [Mycobacteriales bacterium]
MSGVDAQDLAAVGAAVDDVLGDHSDPLGDGYDAPLWSALASAGLTTVGLPEAAGGSGGSLTAAVRIACRTGAFAARIPLADSSLVAGWLLTAAGLPLPAGPVTTGDGVVSFDGLHVSGTLTRVPYASQAERLVVLAADGTVAAIDPAALSVSPGSNVAGEPRNDVALDLPVEAVGHIAGDAVRELRLRGALARSAQIAGALQRVQSMVVTYAREREQFGRPIARFQAVQHEIATLVCEVTAASASVDGAAAAWESHGADAAEAAFAVAAAKVRTAQAASLVATISHQVHGAIGMTQEHPLHAWTTRLWSWRSEWGGESSWSQQLADAAVAAGTPQVWALVQSAS